jgi:uncharacterized membrane protein
MRKETSGSAARPARRSKSTIINCIFVFTFAAIVFFQTFFWIFANHVEPIVLGLPFSMFFVTALVVLEFVVLVLLYKFDQK